MGDFLGRWVDLPVRVGLPASFCDLFQLGRPEAGSPTRPSLRGTKNCTALGLGGVRIACFARFSVLLRPVYMHTTLPRLAFELPRPHWLEQRRGGGI